MRHSNLWILIICFCMGASATDLPEGYWDLERTDAILAKTMELRLAPDLSGLGPGEKQAVAKLLEAGKIIQKLYEDSRHYQSTKALADLEALDAELGSPKETQNLLKLYRVYRGPLGIELNNRKGPFLPVPAYGLSVYPVDLTRGELDAWLEKNPDQESQIKDVRTVVRRTLAAALDEDLAVLRKHPTLDVLNPGLQDRLKALRAAPSANGFYTVPYSVAYADSIMAIYTLVWQAADVVQGEDQQFAGYLRNRARDLLTNDYESGDASWVTGRFRNLNLQLGAYETYDDTVFGVKAFWSMSLLIRDLEQSRKLSEAIGGLQRLEDSLPFEHHKTVREDIPVGVYRIIADFGQARSTNTATILPNDALFSSRYGRTILLRYNILGNPVLYKGSEAAWKAATAAEHHGDINRDGNFHRTLWHEIGHYLGPGMDKQGRSFSRALGKYADLMEEMKSDLISLYSTKALRESGYHDETGLRSVYASGIRRTLQKVKPRPTQPYNNMQLMQMNWFLEAGLLHFRDGVLHIRYERYHQVVRDMLERVLALQYEGNQKAVADFVTQYTVWREDLHGVIAANMSATEQYRFKLVRYGALGE